MTPLRVVAHLASPAILREPPVLDGLLLAGEAARIAAERPLSVEEADALPLPLARVETEHGWWWAASQVHLSGSEALAHASRRPGVELHERLTSGRSLNVVSGPDKMLRSPLYYRTGMLRLEWTCIGDATGVARALSRVCGVGHRRTHGWGWVRRWVVSQDPSGPALADYGTDLAIRHLPVEAVTGLPAGRVMRRRLPLTPPYWQAARSVDCWQAGAV